MIDRIYSTTNVNHNGSVASVAVEPSGEPIELTPQLGELTGAFLEFCRLIEAGTVKLNGGDRIIVTKKFRNDLLLNRVVKGDELALLFSQNVILDLVAQGWTLKVGEAKLFVYPPAIDNEIKEVAKEIIRNTHLLGRDIQLNEKSVREFIKGMQRRRLSIDGHWHSIFSLMRDGKDLAEKLSSIGQIKSEAEKREALSKTISPYLQFVEPGEVCEFTGLRLGDIWRYFRHTWVNEYKSIPGRSIMILIRDAAAPNHPVIGIAALGSSVVQHKVRDKWIGWHPETLVEEIVGNPDPQIVKWLLNSVERLIGDIYSTDLITEGIFSVSDIENPTEEIIKSLFEESDLSIKKHRKEPQRTKHNIQKNGKIPDDFWEKEAQTFLYRSKRCKQLAKLFSIRRTFKERGFKSGNKKIQAVCETSQVRSAIQQLVRMIKAEHVGVDMLDITVCGAIAPYNALLGGKLICMLLCSPEIPNYYAGRYKNHTSIIASAMKGEPVVRQPRLVLLCTTSLYGVGSSQYNRVKIPLKEIGIDSDKSIVYNDLGHSFGFGTYHFSRTTVQLGSKLNSRKKSGRHVNSIFGEGVNPLMRKIRESLDFVGLNSESLLHHGNKRVTYGIELATNFGEILLGRDKKPNYLIPHRSLNAKTAAIADYWRRRWLYNRINRPEILEKVSRHDSIAHPPSHGAVVPLDISDEVQEIDFSS